MFRFLRRENLVKQSQQSISCPAINTPEKDGAAHSESSSDSDGEIAEVSRKQRMFARRSIRRDRKKQKEQQKKIENNTISMDDFLSKQTEFKLWLKEEKQKTPADLKSPKLKSYFKDFVKMWNKKKLPQKYYRGSSGTETPPPSRNQRFSFVEGSPFPDLSGFPQPIDLSLEGMLLDSPFSTFGKCPGDPLTPQSTPRIIKLPDIKAPDSADKENSNDGENLYVKNIKEPSSGKKKKKNKNSTPKKSKMKNDNPYKVTVLSWTSKGELSVHPASPSSVGKPENTKSKNPFRSHPVGQLNTSVPYQEVKDNLEISDYDPLYADPDPWFNGNTSVSRSKSLDSGLQLDSPRQVVGEGAKSVEEIYAVPVKKKRMSAETGKKMSEEEVTSPPPPLPPKRKSPLEAWPYQSVQLDGHGPAPVFSMKKDSGNDEFPSPPPPGQGFRVFAEAVLSPKRAESPMRMAVSMPDLCDSNKNEYVEDEESSSSSSSNSSSASENESEEETFEVKVKVLDPEIQEFLDAGLSEPPPPPDLVSEFYPPIRLSLLPPPPPELLIDTPPEDDVSRLHSDAYTSHSSLIAEQGTPRSSKMLDEDIGTEMVNHWASKCTTPKSLLCINNDVTETPPPVLVPITSSLLEAVKETREESSESAQTNLEQTAPKSSLQAVPITVTQVKETSLESRRVSVGPLLVPPPLQALSKKSDANQSQSSSDSNTSANHKYKSTGETPNHDYLDEALTDFDTSAEKDEVFSYRKALSGAMHSLKSAYASSVEDITADVPKRHQWDILGTGGKSHLYVEDVIDQRSTPKHDTRNRHHSENSAVQLQKCIAKRKRSSEDDSSSNSSTLSSIPEFKETEEKNLKKKPPVLKPKPSKSKVTEAVEKARQRQSSSGCSSTSSTSSDTRSNCSATSASEENITGQSSTAVRSVQRVLGQLNQNCANRPSTPPRKPPRTPSSASKTEHGREQNCGIPLTPTRQKVKGILKTTPTSGVKCQPRGSPQRERKSSCSKPTENAAPSTRPTSLGGVFETDIDSVFEDNSENRDPNCATRGVRETDLDKILEEMQSSYLLSPLMTVDASSEMNL